MARVSDAELERLKKEVSIQGLAEARGIKLQPHGRNFIGLCPFHDDKEPSLVITPEKNLFNCLGACGSGGTVIDWVMKAEKLSFREAVNFLQNCSGVGSASTSAVASSSAGAKTSSPAAAPISLSAADHELLLQTIDYYHKTLKETPEAIAYLEKRGIYSPEIIDKFKIGYSNRSFGLNLPVKHVKSGLEIRTRLQKLGLFRDSGHEHFAGSVTFPIFDAGGNVVEIYGRKIRNNLRQGTVYHLYLPGPHAGIFNPYAERLTFMDDRTRTRRDHEKYLTLIDTIALLHQYQRPIKQAHEGKLSYIESTLQDIETANQLADDILGHSLDELPPQSRRLLLLIEEMVLKACERLKIEVEDYRFSRRDIREHTGIGNTQLRVHLARLEELEYLIPHRGSRGQTFEYELFYDGKGKDGKSFLHGLISVEKLRGNYDVNLAGANDNKAGQNQKNAGLKRGQNGGVAGGCRGIANPDLELFKDQKSAKTLKNAHLETELENSSYRSHVSSLAAKQNVFKGNGSEKTIEVVE